MRYFFLFVLPMMTLLSNEKSLETLTLQNEEILILEEFFKAMCLESEGGYVLYGKKPICINGFYVNDNFGGPSEFHRSSVYLKEGAALWNRIFFKNHGKIIIHIYDQPDSLAKNYIHILFINEELFYRTVQDNLILFQYVLGPNVTPESLLKKLIDPKETFHSVLREDKVLIGILLGFGAQNALYVSRIENLQEAYINSKENVPFENKLHALNGLLGDYKDVFLRLTPPKAKVAFSSQPSFSYNTFEDEIKNSIGLIDISSSKLSKNQPRFIFGKLKKSEENDRLISELEHTQDEIIELFSSKKFLEKILKIIFPDMKIAFNEKINNKSIAIENSIVLLNAVSESIYDSIKNENKNYFDGFIQGLIDAEKNCKTQEVKNFNHYEKLKVIKVAKENVDKADLVFSDLLNNDFLLAEKGVIYKTLKKGTGKFLTNQATVLVNYRVNTPNGEVLQDTWRDNQPVLIDLNELIAGFSRGMMDMQEGEIREIIIHPTASYGLYTNLQKGIHLLAKVELLSIESLESSIPLKSIEFFDFTQAFNFLAQHNFDEISKSEGYFHGYAMGSYYKNQTFFSLKELIASINELPKKNKFLHEDFSSLINKLHWNIYHQAEI